MLLLWTSWAQTTSLKSKLPCLAPMGVLQDGAELPKGDTLGAGEPRKGLEVPLAKHRSRGQDHGHPSALLSLRTIHPERCELNDLGPHSQPGFGGPGGMIPTKHPLPADRRSGSSG